SVKCVLIKKKTWGGISRLVRTTGRRNSGNDCEDRLLAKRTEACWGAIRHRDQRLLRDAVWWGIGAAGVSEGAATDGAELRHRQHRLAIQLRLRWQVLYGFPTGETASGLGEKPRWLICVVPTPVFPS